jgi:hypothetical protein
MQEKQLVKRLKRLLEGSPTRTFRKVFAHTNLSTKQFRDIWSDWWQEGVPPRTEVDLIPVFAEGEDVALVGIEVEYFRSKKESFIKGLDQALSFALFGFDSVGLWHVFSEEFAASDVEKVVGPTVTLIKEMNLPVVYLATKLIDGEKFEFFAPLRYWSSLHFDASRVLKILEDEYRQKRNPLLYKESVQRARKTLKVVLKIPVGR